MARIYDILEESSIEHAVTMWCGERTQHGRHVAAEIIFQALLDCLIGCSSNETERCQVPSGCTEERGDQLIEQVLQRQFNSNVNAQMQQKLVEFLYHLLAIGKTVPWCRRVESYLKLCSENNQTIFLAARISVKFFEGLVTLRDCICQGIPVNTLQDPRARARQMRFLANRISGMIDIIVTCLKYVEACKITAQALFPSMERKPYFLEIDRIEELFCGGKSVDYIHYSFNALRAFVNEKDDLGVRNRALAICTSPVVVKYLEEAMKCDSKRVVRLAFELAVDIQDHYPQRKIFSSEAIARVFDLDVQANGVAKLIGHLMYLMNHDPNDVNAFYRQTVEFFGKYIRNNDSGRYLIEACPNSDIFTDWETIFKYIDGIRNKPESRAHIKTLCDIVVESVKILTHRINNEHTGLDDCAGYRAKVGELLCWLPRYIRHFAANLEIVGELLFFYKHINSDMYLDSTAGSYSKLLVRLISRKVQHFIDFNVQCNAVELFQSFHQIMDFDFVKIVGILHGKLHTARKRFANAVTDLDWSEISADFMRFSSFSFFDTVLEASQFEHVINMCSTDLFEKNTYATMENAPLFGYNLIMLSSCYRLANDTTHKLPASIPNINQFVTYLLNVLDRSKPGSEVGFVPFATFASLCKLFPEVNDVNQTLLIERPEACVQKMIQFVFIKLTSIDQAPHDSERDENTWPNISTMCSDVSDWCLRFARDSELELAAVIQFCSQHPKKTRQDIGIQFLRASLRNGVPFFSRIIAKVLWDMPRFALKRALMLEMNKILATETQADQMTIHKEIAGDVLKRVQELGAARNGSRSKVVMQSAKKILELVTDSIKDYVIGEHFDFSYTGMDGRREMCRIKRGAVTKPVHRRRQRRT